MIILLLLMLWTFSLKSGTASASGEYLINYERPGIDIVRKLDYARRIQGSQFGLSENSNIEDQTGICEEKGKFRIGRSNISDEKINELRKCIASRTLGLCEFTCHKCYRCVLVNSRYSLHSH